MSPGYHVRKLLARLTHRPCAFIAAITDLIFFRQWQALLTIRTKVKAIISVVVVGKKQPGRFGDPFDD